MQSPYINCFIKELGIANSLDNPQYTSNCTYYEIMENHCLYRVPLEFHPQMKNWIFLHSTRYINCTIVITNGVLFWNAPHKISKLCACIPLMTKSGLRSNCITSYSMCGVNQLWILTKCNDLEYIQSRALRAIKLTHLTYLPSFPHSNLKTDYNN
jgi:hypothetical protein